MRRGWYLGYAPVAVAVALGLLLRLLYVLRAPLIHPDGPAYLELVEALLRGEVGRVFGGYYSPAYVVAVVPLAAAGVPAELAGRLAATLAGVATLPLLHAASGRLLGPGAAAGAVLIAALHPALVKAAGQVLPETLFGALLLGWLLALLSAERLAAFAGAGMLAGAGYLARPEGVLLVPLGLLRCANRRGLAACAAYAAAAALVMSPTLLALHGRSGRWQLSPREAVLAARAGIAGERTIVGAALRHPGVFARRAAVGGVIQTWHDAKALGPLLWVPFAVGLAESPPTGAAVWPLAVVGSFTLLPLALDPSPRYAVPLVPLLMPWVGAGLVAIGRRLGRRAAAAAAVLGGALVVQALWISHPFDQACSREVSRLVLERYGPGQALVAVDGRFAYAARGRSIVPRTTDPEAALALARRHGARLWLTRPEWIRPPWMPPPDAHAIARPCGGAFVLFELG